MAFFVTSDPGRDGHPLQPGSVLDALRHRIKDAGVPPTTVHELRHSDRDPTRENDRARRSQKRIMGAIYPLRARRG
jgi:hypothetical protein